MIAVPKLHDLSFTFLAKAGTPPRIAERVAQALVLSSLKGVDSHGVMRLPHYLEQIDKGLVIPDALPEVVRETASTAVVDGHRGFGHAAAEFSVQIALATQLYGGMTELLQVTGLPGLVQGIGARFGIYFGISEPVTNYRQAVKSDRDMEVRFLLGCVERGLYLHDYAHETPMHHGYSSQHTLEDIDEALNIIEDVFREMR